MLRVDYIYKFMTLLPKDYYLIPSNSAKKLLRRDYIYKFMTLLPNDYYLIPGNGAKKKLVDQIFVMIKMCKQSYDFAIKD